MAFGWCRISISAGLECDLWAPRWQGYVHPGQGPGVSGCLARSSRQVRANGMVPGRHLALTSPGHMNESCQASSVTPIFACALGH